MITPQFEEARKATQFKPGQSGNPAGPPKGHKKLATWVRELGEDDEFEANILDSKVGLIEYKGAPIKAVVMVAYRKAAAGDVRWADWILKAYGDSQKFEIEHSGEIKGEYNAVKANDYAESLKLRTKPR